MKKIIIALLLLIPFQLTAMDLYIKGGGAWAKTSIEVEELGLDANTESDDDGLSLKGAMGISTNFIALEIGFIDTVAANLGDLWDDRYNTSGEYISIFLKYPTPGGPSLFAQIGYINWDTELDFFLDSNANTDGKDTFYGLGVEINLKQASSLSFEVEHYPFDSIEMTRIGVNYKYSFNLNPYLRGSLRSL